MAKPTILLGMPDHMGIYREISAALAAQGFDVTELVFDERQYRRLSLKNRFRAEFRKWALGERGVRQKLRQAEFEHNMLKIVDSAGRFDYALFIRGDLYSRPFLDDVRTRIRYAMVNYQWDGLDRYPEIWQRVSAFDRFYVFAPADLHSGADFLPLTNFYLENAGQSLPQADRDFYFLGSHLPGRSDAVAAFGRQAEQYGWTLDFNIVCSRRKIRSVRQLYPGSINVLDSGYAYGENLRRARRAKVLVDFKTPGHNGLSFRAFEAIGYCKKLITTNAAVRHYDFYHPDNILIWDGRTFDGIDDFLRRPYREMEAAVREKYSFGNWIRYVLQIPPYRPIDLPLAGVRESKAEQFDC
ncbi:hypothetical protein V6667_01295 [Neisseria leonii]|uniref:Uncharacterized protein n=1 Tax=Neisseria leonii TaxID=2995413 RepID=A0A9X4E2N1_9NEIS|nr:hypothetical protein [Neisseria sp. 51.81]MDD9328490.1 hypothetical protein [Neisseria sp. 51.81]